MTTWGTFCFLPLCEFKFWIKVIKLGAKCLYTLRQLISPFQPIITPVYSVYYCQIHLHKGNVKNLRITVSFLMKFEHPGPLESSSYTHVCPSLAYESSMLVLVSSHLRHQYLFIVLLQLFSLF